MKSSMPLKMQSSTIEKTILALKSRLCTIKRHPKQNKEKREDRPSLLSRLPQPAGSPWHSRHDIGQSMVFPSLSKPQEPGCC